MASILRSGVVDKKPEVKLSGEVECDEVYVVAGHKGNPDAVKKRGDQAAETGCEVLVVEEHQKKKSPLFLA